MTDLERATARLRETLEAVEEDIRQRAKEFGYDVDPALARDPNGRYLLLDAQTALVNGLATLTSAQKSN